MTSAEQDAEINNASVILHLPSSVFAVGSQLSFAPPS